jgi:hypothetical protein
MKGEKKEEIKGVVVGNGAISFQRSAFGFSKTKAKGKTGNLV